MVLHDVQVIREVKKFANHCSRRLISKYCFKIRGFLGLWGLESSAGTEGLEIYVARPADQVLRGRNIFTF